MVDCRQYQNLVSRYLKFLDDHLKKKVQQKKNVWMYIQSSLSFIPRNKKLWSMLQPDTTLLNQCLPYTQEYYASIAFYTRKK